MRLDMKGLTGLKKMVYKCKFLFAQIGLDLQSDCLLVMGEVSRG